MKQFCPGCRQEIETGQSNCNHCDADLTFLNVFTERASYKVEQANKALKRGKRDQALILLQEAKMLDPEVKGVRELQEKLESKQRLSGRPYWIVVVVILLASLTWYFFNQPQDTEADLGAQLYEALNRNTLLEGAIFKELLVTQETIYLRGQVDSQQQEEIVKTVAQCYANDRKVELDLALQPPVLAQQVEEELALDSELTGYEFTVLEENGFVKLTGKVDNLELVFKAAAVAGEVHGVAGVDVRGVDPELSRPAGYYYRLQEGDTFYDLAGRFYGDNNRWPLIQEVNQELDPYRLMPESDIIIPQNK